MQVGDNGGSLTVDGTFWQATQPVSFGLVSLASGTEIRSTATINNFPATYPVTDNGGSLTIDGSVGITAGVNNIGDVDVLTLPPLPTGTNFIGLATVTMANSLSIGMTTLFPGPSQIGSVTVSNFPGSQAVTGTFFQATQPVSFNQLVSLASGTLVGLNPSANHIGSVSIFGNINTTAGMTTLFPGPNQIGSVTVSNFPATQPVSFGLVSLASGTFVSLNTGVNFIGLVSVQGNVNIQSGATVTPVPISSYTSFATTYSASGNATLFVAPAAQRWVLKDLLISSQGNQIVSILSGAEQMFPPIALATLGGFVMNNGDSGLRAKAVNTGFVLNLGATATLSVLANVRFE